LVARAAYRELVWIVSHPEFSLADVPPSISTIKRLAQGLPLMQIHGHEVPIDAVSTASKAGDSKTAYTYSLKDWIKRVLNTPKLRKSMYFGPGIQTNGPRREFWEGDLWKESPLFGDEFVSSDRGSDSRLADR
jgi:hypothetical protein